MVRDSDQLRYTTRAAVQMLHHKPPVPMVPHLALKDAVLGGRKIHKGTVLIPSIAYSARMSGASREYDPDRKETDNMFLKNMVFGGGQHKCPGRRYAESLLTVFLAVCINDYVPGGTCNLDGVLALQVFHEGAVRVAWRRLVVQLKARQAFRGAGDGEGDVFTLRVNQQDVLTRRVDPVGWHAKFDPVRWLVRGPANDLGLHRPGR